MPGHPKIATEFVHATQPASCTVQIAEFRGPASWLSTWSLLTSLFPVFPVFPLSFPPCCHLQGPARFSFSLPWDKQTEQGSLRHIYRVCWRISKANCNSGPENLSLAGCTLFLDEKAGHPFSWRVPGPLIMECYLIGASSTSVDVGAKDAETKPHVSS